MSKQHIATAWAERESGLTGDRTKASAEKKEEYYTEYGRAIAILTFAEGMGLKVELPNEDPRPFQRLPDLHLD
jgi:hypothetical protein